jgi:hypothetical protein
LPTPTYTALATVTLGSATSSVTFSSIPATYRDLIVVTNQTGSASAENVFIALNGDGAANYTRVIMVGGSGGPASLAQTTRAVTAIYGSNRQTMNMSIMDYSATDKHKTMLIRGDNAGFSEVVAQASRWANTAAVNSLGLVAASGTFSIGSTFALYGIAS